MAAAAEEARESSFPVHLAVAGGDSGGVGGGSGDAPPVGRPPFSGGGARERTPASYYRSCHCRSRSQTSSPSSSPSRLVKK